MDIGEFVAIVTFFILPEFAEASAMSRVLVAVFLAGIAAVSGYIVIRTIRESAAVILPFIAAVSVVPVPVLFASIVVSAVSVSAAVTVALLKVAIITVAVMIVAVAVSAVIGIVIVSGSISAYRPLAEIVKVGALLHAHIAMSVVAIVYAVIVSALAVTFVTSALATIIIKLVIVSVVIMLVSFHSVILVWFYFLYKRATAGSVRFPATIHSV
jgi:hypothetical protein